MSACVGQLVVTVLVLMASLVSICMRHRSEDASRCPSRQPPDSPCWGLNTPVPLVPPTSPSVGPPTGRGLADTECGEVATPHSWVVPSWECHTWGGVFGRWLDEGVQLLRVSWLTAYSPEPPPRVAHPQPPHTLPRAHAFWIFPAQMYPGCVLSPLRFLE